MSETNTRADFDSTKAEAFAGRFLAALNNGALCLMTSVGHRTGLFDVLSKLPPATSEEIASQAVPLPSIGVFRKAPTIQINYPRMLLRVGVLVGQRLNVQSPRSTHDSSSPP
jgi:hypothetical protein